MKTIGFIDYYLSEWHANHYPQWIKEAGLCLGVDIAVKYAWAELDISPVDGKTTEQWCDEFGAERCSDMEELCEKSDYIIVLAPSNPDKHLKYAEKVLKYKKNTYIDKTFAPDSATAEKIFDIAKRYGTEIFSTSALRYATELDDATAVVCVDVKGGGSNIAEYIIHQIEMSVKIMQKPAKSVKVEMPKPNNYLCEVDFGTGKPSFMEYDSSYGFEIAWENEKGEKNKKNVVSDYFLILMREIVKFFESGKEPFDVAQTIWAMKIREGILNGVENLGKTIKIK